MVKHPRPNATSRLLFADPHLTWVDRAIASIRREWDVEEGIRTWTCDCPEFGEGAHLIPADVFSALLVFDTLPRHLLSPPFRQSFRDYFTRNHHPSGINYFFVDRSLISTNGIAADADTAAMFLTVALEEGLVEWHTLHSAMEILAHNTNAEGILQVFLAPRGRREGRLDPVVCANVLSLLYLFEHPSDQQPSEDYLYAFLARREHLHGSLQYTLPSTILYFITRAIFRFGRPALQQRFGVLLRTCAEELLALDPMGDLDRAMRILVCRKLGLECPAVARLAAELHDHQHPNGAWGIESIYRTVRSQLHFGAESITTAFAVRALAGRADRPHS